MNNIEKIVREEAEKLNALDIMLTQKLAGMFYEAHGYDPKGVDFANSSHPQERLMFQMALIAKHFYKEEE